jgi:xylan 1,4-beta-xylosidase
VHIEVDAAQAIGPLKPIWRFFGADEPNYAYTPTVASCWGNSAS